MTPTLDPAGAALLVPSIYGENAYCDTLDLGICFAAGTPVLMADGSTKPIETIEPGESVLAVSEDDPLGPVAPKPVDKVFRNTPSDLIRLTRVAPDLDPVCLRHKRYPTRSDPIQ